MEQRLLPFAERQAPRYTSYPSANHFSTDVDSRVYGSWLGALDEEAALSLYVHVPYCRQLCWYCGCNTFMTRGGDTSDFVASMMSEIELVAAIAGSRRVENIHWGGGTPNVLAPDEFLRLQHQLDFWFDIAPNAAHAIELDPRHITGDLARTYAGAGVNRISLGVQDFNAHVQAAIGRVQPYEQVRESVATLREAGLSDLSFDLMYGLPGQSSSDLAQTIKLAAQLEPNRIALFGYAHVPWFKRRQRLINADTLPDASERYDQSELARRMLRDLGYESIGLDHFAWPTDALAKAAQAQTVRRNFQGYVVGATDALIGFGPSAISRLPQGYAQNIPTVSAWRGAIQSGKLPTVRGHAQRADDIQREAIIHALMCNFEVDLTRFGGWSSFPDAYVELAPLIDAGIAVTDRRGVKVPESMRQFCRLVAMAFDVYASSSATAHSRAI